MLQKINQVPVLNFTLTQAKVFVFAFSQVNSFRILMRATMLGLETAPDWCSPLRHSWTVQYWTRTEHFDWVTGTHALLRPGWQPPAVLHLTCDSKQRFCFYSVVLLLILRWAPPPYGRSLCFFFFGAKLNACTPQAPVKYFSKSLSTSSGEDATTCGCL